MIIYRFIFTIILLNLIACANFTPQTPLEKIMIAPQISMIVPPLNTLGASVEATQMITGHYNNKTFTMQSQVKITPEECLLVGMDVFGGILLSIRWNKEGITYHKSPLLPSELQASHILADFIFINWPENIIRHSLLENDNVKLIVTPSSRSIYKNGIEILRANYNYDNKPYSWSGTIYYHNLAWKYKLDIQSVEQKK